jgi:hypothetical protein
MKNATFRWNNWNIWKTHLQHTCIAISPLQHMQHPKWSIWNIHLNAGGARCLQSPVIGAANDAYRCGPVLLSWTSRVGHSLSLVTAYSLVTPRMHRPYAPHASRRASGRTRSQALRKDRCGLVWLQLRAPFFFLVITSRGSRFVWTDGHPQRNITVNLIIFILYHKY